MMGRPIGVTVLGALAAAVGIMNLLLGFQLGFIQIFGPIPSGSGVLLSGLLTIFVGAMWLAVAWSLWSLQSWALLFVEIMAIFGLIDAVFVLFASGSLAYGIGAAILPTVILWYASREHVRAAFAVGSQRR